MSFAQKREELEREREAIACKRKSIERKIALREAAFAEHGAIAYQNYKAKWKRTHAASVKAVERNREFLHFVRETDSKMSAACLQQLHQLSPGSKLLSEERKRYELKVDRLRPGWEQKVQQFRMQKLRELDQKRRTVEYRRRLAQKTFEREQELEAQIGRMSQELAMNRALEKQEERKRQEFRHTSRAWSASESAFDPMSSCVIANKDTETRQRFPEAQYEAKTSTFDQVIETPEFIARTSQRDREPSNPPSTLSSESQAMGHHALASLSRAHGSYSDEIENKVPESDEVYNLDQANACDSFQEEEPGFPESELHEPEPLLSASHSSNSNRTNDSSEESIRKDALQDDSEASSRSGTDRSACSRSKSARSARSLTDGKVDDSADSHSQSDSSSEAADPVEALRAESPALLTIDSSKSFHTKDDPEKEDPLAFIEKIPQIDQLKALKLLVGRMEDAIEEKEEFSFPMDANASSTIEILRSALGNQKAQLAFYGADKCMETILCMTQAVGRVIFPPKAFDGILDHEKLKSLHRSNANMMQLWTTLSELINKLMTSGIKEPQLIVDTFLAALLSQSQNDTRWERKLKALLSSTAPSEANDFLHVAKVPKSLPIEPLPTKTDSSLVPSKATSILQAAFLGSSASINKALKKSNSESILRTFGSPSSFSNKLLSAFEDDDDLDFHFAGTKQASQNASFATPSTCTEEKDALCVDF